MGNIEIYIKIALSRGNRYQISDIIQKLIHIICNICLQMYSVATTVFLTERRAEKQAVSSCLNSGKLSGNLD